VTPTDFLKFWRTVNALLATRGLPELNYGEARGYYNEYQAR
jgi:hypothetical protein